MQIFIRICSEMTGTLKTLMLFFLYSLIAFLKEFHLWQTGECFAKNGHELALQQVQ
jgi:hypothetical protein